MVDVSTENIESRLKHPFFEKDLAALRFNSPISVAYTILMLKMERFAIIFQTPLMQNIVLLLDHKNLETSKRE